MAEVVIMLYDGVMFDLDGTLWDSGQSIAESWNRTVAGYGYKSGFTADDVHSIMGMRFGEISKVLFSRYGEKADEICLSCLKDENEYISKHGAHIYEGIGEMLCTLSKECPLCIVSNCQCGYIECFLSVSGFANYFADYICEGDSGLGKADNIKLMTERHGFKYPVFVGDTEGDGRSAEEAGCRFIHAAYGFGKGYNEIGSIHCPAELLNLLK